MAAVSEGIVREYFELQGFLVRQQRKYITRTQREDDEVDYFLVWNPQPKTGEATLPFVLGSEHVPLLHRAIVVVKGWHTETFSSGVLTSQPEIFRFVSPAVFQQAARALGGGGSLLRILVVPSLPASTESREQSVSVLKSHGVDAVIPFCTVLADLIAKVEVNRNYQKSDLLQVLRILKNYGFFREPQLELFRPRQTRRKKGEAARPAPDGS
jgi:hypothetical protein